MFSRNFPAHCSDPVPRRQIREARVGLCQQGELFVIQHCTFKLLFSLLVSLGNMGHQPTYNTWTLQRICQKGVTQNNFAKQYFGP